ncbi:MAG: class I SAM-dependent methyltransferase [Muribaculaceae bacterium]|nr:class I SAM-dependent methyltransferase [Muribaculaceae bacterium]
MDFTLESYIRHNIDPEPDYLRSLDRLTNLRLINGRMCSGHIQGRLLKMLVGMIRPKLALELGTFSGYSALCIAEGMDADGRLHTFEIDDELEDFIREGFASSPHGEKIVLHIGDAAKEIERWEKESFDFIFIDADKREYCEYYRLCLPLLKKGGYMIADNTLWDGHVTEPPEKQSAHTRALIEFNRMVAVDPSVEKVIIPLRDGLTLIRKI